MKNGGSVHSCLYVYQILQAAGFITAFKSSCAPGGMTGNVMKAVTSHKWNKIAYMSYKVYVCNMYMIVYIYIHIYMYIYIYYNYV